MKYALIAIMAAIILWGMVALFNITRDVKEKNGERDGVVATSTPLRTVTLYYYSPEKDMDAGGNVRCSETGLVPVERTIASTTNIIGETMQLLILGGLTAEERAQGVTTEFPLRGVVLERSELDRGVLRLTFADSENRLSGGSCRIGIIRAELERTAKQFPGVMSVEFLPEGLLEP